MFSSRDDEAFAFEMEPGPSNQLNLGSLELEHIEGDTGDTDSASENETTLPNKFGLTPFLLTKYNDRTLDIKGENFPLVELNLYALYFDR